MSAARAVPAPRDVDTLKPAPAYLLFGGDEFLVSENTRKLVDRLCPPDQQAFGLEIIEPRGDTVADGVEAVSRTLEGLQTMGFFGDAKTVWLRDAAFLSVPRTMKSEETKASVDRLVREIKKGFAEGTVLVVSARGLDKRSAFYKVFGSAGHVLEYAMPDRGYRQEAKAKETLGVLLKRAGLSAKAGVLDRLVGKAGTDTRQLANEVEKLSLYLGDRTEVTAEAIHEIVSPAREALSWDLEDALGDKNLPEALKMLRQLLFQGESPVGIVIRLESRFRELIIFYGCISRKWCRLKPSGRGHDLVWKDSPDADAVLSRLPRDPRAIHSFRAGRLAAQALNYTGAELLEAQTLLQSAHEHLVSTSLPDALTLEFLVLRLVGGKGGANR